MTNDNDEKQEEAERAKCFRYPLYLYSIILLGAPIPKTKTRNHKPELHLIRVSVPHHTATCGLYTLGTCSVPLLCPRPSSCPHPYVPTRAQPAPVCIFRNPRSVAANKRICLSSRNPGACASLAFARPLPALRHERICSALSPPDRREQPDE